ncbi:MAG: tyrosine-type recombinase/integrase [Chitinispirillaceae bacterium]|nr:tyrosine-type recombinase/integrase [Chitinispirillaceae bacterium]
MNKELNPAFRLLLHRYTEYLQASGYTEVTCRSYLVDVKPFLRYLEEGGITDIAAVELADIQGYYGSLSEHTYRGRLIRQETKANLMQRVRALFRYLHKSGKIASDPMANMAMPKRRKNLPRNIPEISELPALMEQPDMESPIGMRDRAIMEILYSTGLRNAELRSLECVDADLDARVLNVRGKGGRYDQVPFGREAANALHNYLHFGRDRLMSGYKVKRSSISTKRLKEERGHEFRGGHGMTSQDLHWLVKRYSEKAGKRINPHTLRHACATHLLRRGADIRHIQKLLRHANLNTTQIYTHVAIEDLKEAQRRFHPRETEPET